VGEGTERDVGGGLDCLQAPTCAGDAIDCAVVRQTWETRCVFKIEDGADVLGKAIVAGNDPKASEFPWSPGNAAERDFSSSISQAPWLSGSCPAPLVITIPGKTAITWHWDEICPYLSYMGLAGVAAALIVAARLVATGGS
jgi:hypothetical protein